jgi:hypothetical protein
METTYNGWPNYETWAAHLWLSNDQGTYETARELAAAVRSGDRHDEDALVNFVHDVAFGSDDVPASLGSDFINAALTAVDYWALVDALTED